MQIEKYRAETIKEAIDKVKRILGPEAMILSTTKLGDKDKNNCFEITAAPPGYDCTNKNTNTFGEVKSELLRIKEMIYLLNHSAGGLEKLIMNPDILSFYGKLIRCGVKDEYARLFLERTGVFNGHAVTQPEKIRAKTFKEIMKAIEVKDPFEMKDNRQVVAALVGTTGVGKTTTIAKLAAQLMLNAGKKVGLISIDSYRIGAMEQLKAYANILGIPCFQVFKRKDLLLALRRMDGRDIVLIDTAGQSQYDVPRIEELKRMMAEYLAMSCHLLMSVSTTESEMNKTAVNFSPLNYQSYIFTKWDEAEKCGSVINQIMKMKLPVSYITDGQNVPEDIERAEKRKLLKRLFLNRN